MSEPPSVIYLQWYGDQEPGDCEGTPGEVTWSEVRVFAHDVEYRRVPGIDEAAVLRRAVLETFDGVLNCIDGDTARLTITSRANGAVYYAQYPAEKFAEKGIEEEDRFICKTVESDGGTRIEIEAIPHAELTEEDIKAIHAKINGQACPERCNPKGAGDES